jgi:hypothetical protein
VIKHAKLLLFVNPVQEEMHMVAEILDLFGMVSGLVINRGKCLSQKKTGANAQHTPSDVMK